MEEQFVPYELALKLKELGFDAPCLGFYTELENLVIKENVKNQDCSQDKCTAPLWQQAFDWFRNIGIHCWLTYDYPFDSEITGSYKASFYNHMDSSHGVLMNYSEDKHRYVGIKSFSTYKECRLACLEELIELVETKKG